MNAIFKKLNYKNQPAIYVLNAPTSFHGAMDEMRLIAPVHDTLAKAQDVSFALAFTITQAEVDAFATKIAKASVSDAVVWVAYPKGSSKKYTCEFNRDTGWTKLGEHGFEPVRIVALDEDWSALRFRRVEHIKTMVRDFAMTKAGQEKAKAAKQKTPNA